MTKPLQNPPRTRAVAARSPFQTASFRGLSSSSNKASAAARGASRKSGTRCEVELRKALWRLGYRYRIDDASLPGRPDIVLPKYSVLIFCDGDFWHGRNLHRRIAKLKQGHNAKYWTRKIASNVARDRKRSQELRKMGWKVIRVWETDILRDPAIAALKIRRRISRGRLHGSQPTSPSPPQSPSPPPHPPTRTTSPSPSPRSDAAARAAASRATQIAPPASPRSA